MTMRRRIRLTEGDLHRIVKESVNRILQESIMDNMCFQVEEGRYGDFFLWDINHPNFEFTAEAWIEDGHLMCNVSSDNPIGKQMCDSEKFEKMCASAILQECPGNIRGFDRFIENGDFMSYDEAISDLKDDLNYDADTYTKYNKRFAQNVKNSPKMLDVNGVADMG